jgi:hypothetical protein
VTVDQVDAEIRAAANARRLEQLALADLSRLDRDIAQKVAERAVVADNIMTFRFARWRIVIARNRAA